MKHVATILGWPLDHTLSPDIHNAAFRALGLEWTYETWPVPPRRLRRAVKQFRDGDHYMGANVTMPHKERVVAHLDETSGDASAIGAVNTIQKLGPKLIGHNTDVDGFREFLSGDAGYDARDKRALVLGAGGAARAVVRALGELGAAEIVVAGRQEGKRAEVANLVSAIRTATVSWDDASERAAACDLVVNATPLGMSEENPLPGVAWREGQVVVDLVYRPPVTPLMAAARATGAAAWGGLGMLIHQAAASFRIWTGQDPPLETMSAAALHALGPLRDD
ncbi:MAG TPA: shikimate dehydrogenase [Actinomycetota bacterium]